MNSRELYLLVSRKVGRKKINLEVLSIIMAESYFRGPLFRFAEMSYALIFLVMFGRLPNITIGISQINAAYWQEVHSRSPLKVLLDSMSPISNYEICLLYIESHPHKDEKDLLVSYNGKPSHSYVQEFRRRLIEFTQYHNAYLTAASRPLRGQRFES